MMHECSACHEETEQVACLMLEGPLFCRPCFMNTLYLDLLFGGDGE